MEPSYSPLNAGNYKSYEDSHARNGFNQSDEEYDLAKVIYKILFNKKKQFNDFIFIFPAVRSC